MTKAKLAQQLLARAFAVGVPAAWVTGDRVYGDDRRLRMWLESCPQAYVLAVSGKEYGWLGWQQRQVKTLLASLPAKGWTRLSAGDGAKGPRWDDWRWMPLAPPLEPGWHRWLLVRRSVSDPTDLTAYVVFAPQDATLEAVVRVAGSRWTIESGFEAAKGEVGLDHYEVRSWTGWYRHITLAMWALALLAVLRAGTIALEALKKSLLVPQPGHSLAASTAGRGLASRCVSRRVVGSSGAGSWRSCRRRTISCPGLPGAVGIRPSPSTSTTSAVGARWRPGRLKPLSTTVVLIPRPQRPAHTRAHCGALVAG